MQREVEKKAGWKREFKASLLPTLLCASHESRVIAPFGEKSDLSEVSCVPFTLHAVPRRTNKDGLMLMPPHLPRARTSTSQVQHLGTSISAPLPVLQHRNRTRPLSAGETIADTPPSATPRWLTSTNARQDGQPPPRRRGTFAAPQQWMLSRWPPRRSRARARYPSHKCSRSQLHERRTRT